MKRFLALAILSLPLLTLSAGSAQANGYGSFTIGVTFFGGFGKAGGAPAYSPYPCGYPTPPYMNGPLYNYGPIDHGCGAPVGGHIAGYRGTMTHTSGYAPQAPITTPAPWMYSQPVSNFSFGN